MHWHHKTEQHQQVQWWTKLPKLIEWLDHTFSMPLWPTTNYKLRFPSSSFGKGGFLFKMHWHHKTKQHQQIQWWTKRPKLIGWLNHTLASMKLWPKTHYSFDFNLLLPLVRRFSRQNALAPQNRAASTNTVVDQTT